MKHWITAVEEAESDELESYRDAVQEFAQTVGDRNPLLNKLAFRGGILIGKGECEEYWVYEVLTEACDTNGYALTYGSDDMERVIRAGLEKGLAEAPKIKHDNPIFDLILTADQLASLPPMEWLVDDILVDNSLAVLVGESGVGKSFMAIDLAASIATGQDKWHGRRIGRSGKVVYLAGEGLSGLNKRRMAWEKIHKTTIGSNFHILPTGIEADTKYWDYFVDYVEEVEPVLTVIDTLSQTAGRLEENTPSEMARYLKQCGRLREASGGTVLVLHHTGKNGGYRGGSSIKGNVDTLMFLYDDGSDDINLYMNKQKDGPEGSMGDYRLKNVPLGTRPDGKAINSAVFYPAGGSPYDYARDE